MALDRHAALRAGVVARKYATPGQYHTTSSSSSSESERSAATSDSEWEMRKAVARATEHGLSLTKDPTGEDALASIPDRRGGARGSNPGSAAAKAKADALISASMGGRGGGRGRVPSMAATANRSRAASDARSRVESDLTVDTSVAGDSDGTGAGADPVTGARSRRKPDHSDVFGDDDSGDSLHSDRSDHPWLDGVTPAHISETVEEKQARMRREREERRDAERQQAREERRRAKALRRAEKRQAREAAMLAAGLTVDDDADGEGGEGDGEAYADDFEPEDDDGGRDVVHQGDDARVSGVRAREQEYVDAIRRRRERKKAKKRKRKHHRERGRSDMGDGTGSEYGTGYDTEGTRSSRRRKHKHRHKHKGKHHHKHKGKHSAKVSRHGSRRGGHAHTHGHHKHRHRSRLAQQSPRRTRTPSPKLAPRDVLGYDIVTDDIIGVPGEREHYMSPFKAKAKSMVRAVLAEEAAREEAATHNQRMRRLAQRAMTKALEEHKRNLFKRAANPRSEYDLIKTKEAHEAKAKPKLLGLDAARNMAVAAFMDGGMRAQLRRDAAVVAEAKSKATRAGVRPNRNIGAGVQKALWRKVLNHTVADVTDELNTKGSYRNKAKGVQWKNRKADVREVVREATQVRNQMLKEYRDERIAGTHTLLQIHKQSVEEQAKLRLQAKEMMHHRTQVTALSNELARVSSNKLRESKTDQEGLAALPKSNLAEERYQRFTLRDKVHDEGVVDGAALLQVGVYSSTDSEEEYRRRMNDEASPTPSKARSKAKGAGKGKGKGNGGGDRDGRSRASPPGGSGESDAGGGSGSGSAAASDVESKDQRRSGRASPSPKSAARRPSRTHATAGAAGAAAAAPPPPPAHRGASIVPGAPSAGPSSHGTTAGQDSSRRLARKGTLKKQSTRRITLVERQASKRAVPRAGQPGGDTGPGLLADGSMMQAGDDAGASRSHGGLTAASSPTGIAALGKSGTVRFPTVPGASPLQIAKQGSSRTTLHRAASSRLQATFAAQPDVSDDDDDGDSGGGRRGGDDGRRSATPPDVARVLQRSMDQGHNKSFTDRLSMLKQRQSSRLLMVDRVDTVPVQASYHTVVAHSNSVNRGLLGIGKDSSPAVQRAMRAARLNAEIASHPGLEGLEAADSPVAKLTHFRLPQKE